MKIDEVNTSNLVKYLDGYPENVKTALKKLYLCFGGEGKHIVKYYKIGYFGVPEGLQREVEIRQYPQGEILKKYYPKLGYLGNVSMTFSFHRDTGRISPAYYDSDTGRYYSFTEEMMGNNATPKDKDMYDDLEIVHEMYERGFKFLPIDLYKSHATKFQIEGEYLRPPLNSIAGLGNVAAESIMKARDEEKFMSIDDMKIRGKIGDSVTELLRQFGCLEGMSQSNQLSLFG